MVCMPAFARVFVDIGDAIFRSLCESRNVACTSQSLEVSSHLLWSGRSHDPDAVVTAHLGHCCCSAVHYPDPFCDSMVDAIAGTNMVLRCLSGDLGHRLVWLL